MFFVIPLLLSEKVSLTFGRRLALSLTNVEDTHAFPNFVRLPVAFRENSKNFWFSSHLCVSLHGELNNETMKRLFFFLTLTLCVMTVSAQTIGAYVTDTKGPFTNVRNKPKGEVIGKISTKQIVMVTLKNYTNGWWQLEGLPEDAEGAKEIPLAYSATGYWLHWSVVGFDTRNYGGQTLSLRQSPDAGSKVVFSFKEEMQLHPVGMKGDWVKVKTSDGKHEGWIEAEWICDNPLTNCC